MERDADGASGRPLPSIDRTKRTGTLQLDEGEVDLAAGDFVVQQGTWHAWSNRGDEPCVFQAMMVATGPLRD